MAHQVSAHAQKTRQHRRLIDKASQDRRLGRQLLDAVLDANFKTGEGNRGGLSLDRVEELAVLYAKEAPMGDSNRQRKENDRRRREGITEMRAALHRMKEYAVEHNQDLKWTEKSCITGKKPATDTALAEEEMNDTKEIKKIDRDSP